MRFPLLLVLREFEVVLNLSYLRVSYCLISGGLWNNGSYCTFPRIASSWLRCKYSCMFEIIKCV